MWASIHFVFLFVSAADESDNPAGISRIAGDEHAIVFSSGAAFLSGKLSRQLMICTNPALSADRWGLCNTMKLGKVQTPADCFFSCSPAVIFRGDRGIAFGGTPAGRQFCSQELFFFSAF